MANTISSSLMPRIIAVARTALRNNNSLLASAQMEYQAEAGQIGQVISVPYANDLTVGNYTVANTSPAASDVTVGSKTITLDKHKTASFALTGQETQDYDLSSAFERQITKAVAAVIDQVNEDLFAKYYKIPYAVGNSGTGFWASNLDGMGDLNKVLIDNKCPKGNRTSVCSTKDYSEVLKLDNVQRVAYWGTQNPIRDGEIDNLMGFRFLEDNQTPTHTIGTITGDPVASATAIGETSVTITCDSDDAIALKQGDLVEFGDTYSYAVQADLTIANSASGTLTIDRGLVAALAGTENPALATTTCTFDANSLVNIAGDLTGFGLAARLPTTQVFSYSVQGDHTPIVDPQTGFPLMISIHEQFGQVMFMAHALYGVDVIHSSKLCRVLTHSS